MYKIGEFSKITKISSRMLRYYDQEDLLKPSFVDDNGYRYYGDEDLKKIDQIKHLRKYNVSYGEIKTILANGLFDDKRVYADKLEVLKETVSNYETLITELEAFVQASSKTSITNPYEVKYGHKSPFSALCKEAIVDENGLEGFIEQCLQDLSKHALIYFGQYQIVFSDLQALNEGQLAVQLVQPVLEPVQVTEFELHYFEEAETISTLHYGAYETLSQAYGCLCKWAHQNGYELVGSFTEKYYVDSYLTSESNQWITDVSVGVIKKD